MPLYLILEGVLQDFDKRQMTNNHSSRKAYKKNYPTDVCRNKYSITNIKFHPKEYSVIRSTVRKQKSKGHIHLPNNQSTKLGTLSTLWRF